MRKVIAGILVLSCIFCIAPAAFAAEEYVLEYYAPSFFSSDSDLDSIGYDQFLGIFESEFLEGEYTFSFVWEDGLVVSSIGSTYIPYSPGVLTDITVPLTFYLPEPYDTELAVECEFQIGKEFANTLIIFSIQSELPSDLSNSLRYSTFRMHRIGVSDQLDGFLTDISLSFVDFSLENLLAVLLVCFGIVTGPVLCWFAYRYIKAKTIKSFRKGKL